MSIDLAATAYKELTNEYLKALQGGSHDPLRILYWINDCRALIRDCHEYCGETLTTTELAKIQQMSEGIMEISEELVREDTTACYEEEPNDGIPLADDAIAHDLPGVQNQGSKPMLRELATDRPNIQPHTEPLESDTFDVIESATKRIIESCSRIAQLARDDEHNISRAANLQMDNEIISQNTDNKVNRISKSGDDSLIRMMMEIAASIILVIMFMLVRMI